MAKDVPAPLPQGASRALLHGSSPLEILRRIEPGDPLGIADRVRLRLRATGYFLDPARLKARAMARAAYSAVSYRGKPPLGEFIESCIDRAMYELVSEQYAEERNSVPPSHSVDARYYGAIAESTGVELALSRLICLTLNRLPADQRRAFRAVTLERKRVPEVAAAEGISLETFQERLAEAMRAVELEIDAKRLGDLGLELP
jgi:DNA-directed RNA polymerase specialized sigma24 family protein